jgi:hypothetical protein
VDEKDAALKAAERRAAIFEVAMIPRGVGAISLLQRVWRGHVARTRSSRMLKAVHLLQVSRAES